MVLDKIYFDGFSIGPYKKIKSGSRSYKKIIRGHPPPPGGYKAALEKEKYKPALEKVANFAPAVSFSPVYFSLWFTYF